MARMRNLKPGLFRCGELWDAGGPPLVLFFEALWTVADREGRLTDRPSSIRAEACPLLDINPDEALWTLHRTGFVLRYEVAGLRYIQINNFAKHQKVWDDEKASLIPPLPGFVSGDCIKRGANSYYAPSTLNGTPIEALLNTLSNTPINGDINEHINGVVNNPIALPINETLSSSHPLIPSVVSKCKVVDHPEGSRKTHVSAFEKRTSEFDEFWAAYPKKRGKIEARKIWDRMRPPLADVLKALEWQTASESWTENGGQYIPDPERYLKKGRWEDVPDTSAVPLVVPPLDPWCRERGVSDADWVATCRAAREARKLMNGTTWAVRLPGPHIQTPIKNPDGTPSDDLLTVAPLLRDDGEVAYVDASDDEYTGAAALEVSNA